MVSTQQFNSRNKEYWKKLVLSEMKIRNLLLKILEEMHATFKWIIQFFHIISIKHLPFSIKNLPFVLFWIANLVTIRKAIYQTSNILTEVSFVNTPFWAIGVNINPYDLNGNESTKLTWGSTTWNAYSSAVIVVTIRISIFRIDAYIF